MQLRFVHPWNDPFLILHDAKIDRAQDSFEEVRTTWGQKLSSDLKNFKLHSSSKWYIPPFDIQCLQISPDSDHA